MSPIQAPATIFVVVLLGSCYAGGPLRSRAPPSMAHNNLGAAGTACASLLTATGNSCTLRGKNFEQQSVFVTDMLSTPSKSISFLFHLPSLQCERQRALKGRDTRKNVCFVVVDEKLVLI